MKAVKKLVRNKLNRAILTIGFASRFIVLFSAIFGFNAIGLRERLPNDVIWDIGLPVVNLFNRWDSGHYIDIALNWYAVGPEGPQAAWAFFPLFPLCARIASIPLLNLMRPDQAVALAGFVINNLLFFIILFYFYKLSKIVLHDSDLALLSTMVFSLWPGSLFLSCVYAESLFLALVVSALYFLEKDKALFATLLGFLAGWTRPVGFLIFIPFVYEGVEKRSRSLFVQSLIVSLPYLLFNIYGFVASGIFPVREWVYAKYWGQPPFPAFAQILKMDLPVGIPKMGYEMMASMELVFVLAPFIYLLISKDRLVATLSIGSRSKHNEAKYYAFALALLMPMLFYGYIQNLHRFALSAIPMYWFLARMAQHGETAKMVIMSTLAVMLAIGSILFATWRIYL